MKRSRPTRLTTSLIALFAALGGIAAADPAPAPDDWAAQIGGGGPEIPFAVAATRDGAVVAGTFDYRVEIGVDTLEAPREADAFVARYGADGTPRWARALGGRDGDQARAVAVDGDDGTWVAGYFTDRLRLPGGEPLVSRGGADAFLVRFDANGRLTDARAWGGPDADTGLALDAGGDGSIWVTGSFSERVDFSGRSLIASSRRDAFLVRLDPAGRATAAIAAGGPRDDEGRAVVAAADGGAFWLGRFTGTATVGRHVVASSRGPNARALFLARIDHSGRIAWVESIDAPDPAGLALAPDGGVSVAGAFRDRLDLSASSGPTLDAAGGLDGFVATFSRRGRVRWARAFGGPATDSPLALAATSDGELLLTGYFQGTSDFDPGLGVAEHATVDATNADAFVVRLDRSGRFVDARRIGSDGVEQALAIAVAPDGARYLAGLFNEVLTLGGRELTARGKTDAFLTSF